MASLWKLGGLSPKELGKRVWSEMQQDDVFGRAAQLSYYFLLALFPLLIFLTSVIGLVISSQEWHPPKSVQLFGASDAPYGFPVNRLHNAGSERDKQR